jgi:hypothetical protein
MFGAHVGVVPWTAGAAPRAAYQVANADHRSRVPHITWTQDGHLQAAFSAAPTWARTPIAARWPFAVAIAARCTGRWGSRANRASGPERVIDAVEAARRTASSGIDDVIGRTAREAIGKGYARLAGFAPDQVNPMDRPARVPRRA